MWMHLDPNNFLACWEGAVGRVFSLDLFDETVFSSFFVSRLVDGNTDFFRRELYFHLVKPDGAPSRLDCAFLFANYGDAIDACGYWHGFTAGNLVRVSVLQEEARFEADSNWLDILGRGRISRNQIQHVARNYWEGVQREDRAITELLWKGVGRIECQITRQRCYNFIIERHPNSFGLLIRTMMTFDAGLSNFAGLVKYRLTPEITFRPFCQFNEIHSYSRSDIEEYIQTNDLIAPNNVDWTAAHFPANDLHYTPHGEGRRLLAAIDH